MVSVIRVIYGTSSSSYTAFEEETITASLMCVNPVLEKVMKQYIHLLQEKLKWIKPKE